ncbi:MAG: hypothetical protein MUD17_10565 [Gemmatimonadaceae bacterium]|jgi:hypothetical protein|nr:hypothetical protein [Gemmatimonadaceae bacterium]
MTKVDSQVTELIGRNILTAQLLLAGLEVALPMRDRGTDLVIYRDLPERKTRFECLPLQMKAAAKESFSVDRKYEKFPDLLHVHVWNIASAGEDHPVFAMTYAHAIAVAESMGWTRTTTWEKKGSYTTTQPSAKLKELLRQHLMTPERWRNVFSIVGRSAG